MRKPKAPRQVTVAVIITITIIFWVFFTVYRIFVTTPEVDVPDELLAPINPALDVAALENIESRVFVEESDIPETIVEINQAEPTPTQETQIDIEIVSEEEEIATDEGELEAL